MNFISVRTLAFREIKRAFRIPWQTLGTPIITALLYFLIFGSAIGGRIGSIGNLSYSQFILPGLIFMNATMGSFFSTSASFMLSKMMNTLTDLLVTPMSYLEILIGFTFAAVTRGVITAALIYLTGLFFVPFGIMHPLYLAITMILVTAIFGLVGIIIGMWAENFDQLNIFPSFIILPLSMLGGVFYSIQMLPAHIQILTKLDPFFYMVNGMRYGFYGSTDIHPWIALGILAAFFTILAFIAERLLRIGYKIKN